MSARQQSIMEQRWAKAREECPAGTCVPTSRFHIAGCERRAQKVKVTNLNTGVISETTILHSDDRAVKKVLDQHEKQAVLLESMDVPPGILDQVPAGTSHYAHYLPEVPADPDPSPCRVRHDDHMAWTEPAPARPWWKFWGRRG